MASQTSIVFDIETGPAPDEVLARLEPEFNAPANYKDPVKIAEVIEEQRQEWRRKAALYAERGQVLAIGWMDNHGKSGVLEGDEAQMLRDFWTIVKGDLKRVNQIGVTLIGFNSNGFDIPFMVRRSIILGVTYPVLFNGRYLKPDCVDLMQIWSCGVYGASIKLDNLAKALGCGQKNGDGKVFHQLYREDREAALLYLHNDVMMTARCAERMGVFTAPTKQPEGDY